MKKNKFLLLLILSLYSCKDKTNSLEGYTQTKGKQFFYYKHLKNGLTKHIKVFPKTNNISDIFFTNTNGEYDSIAYGYYKNNIIKYKIHYKKNKKLCYDYYENGNIRKEFVIIGKHKQDNIIWYYKNGKIKSIYEIVAYDDSIEYANNKREYKVTGELNKDSTLFCEMILSKDTIRLGDSVKFILNFIKPNDALGTAFFGSIEDYYKQNINYNTVKLLEKNNCFYKPNKKGDNIIEVIAIIGVKMKNGHFQNHNIFLKKQVYVTE